MQTATDLITPVILLTFGGIIVFVIAGFVFLMKSTSTPRYEANDYFQGFQRRKRKEPNSTPGSRQYYNSSTPRYTSYRQRSAIDADGKKIMMIVTVMAIVAIAVSIFTESIDGLLLILTLPIIVRFFRARREKDASDQDNSRSSV